MEENEEYGLPDVEYSPIDRESQSNPNTTQPNKTKMKDQRKKESKAPVYITLAVIFVAIIVALVYFVVLPNQQQKEKERIAMEQQAAVEAEAERQRAEQEEADRIAAQEEADRVAAEEEAANAEPETGTVTVLSEKTGRSYVVVGSFFDGDMAMDAGNKLASEGVSTFILEPSGNVKFYRLAVEDFDSYADATASVENYKGTYGDEIWALRY